jgi:DNA gyrase subunit B
MTELIKQGYIYIAQPPLYKVTKGRKESYVDTESDMDKMLIQMAKENVSLMIKQKSGEESLGNDKSVKVAALSKRLNEIGRSLENKGIALEELFKYRKAKKNIPLYWVKCGAREEFFATDMELSAFMNKQNKGGQVDLFSGEDKNYKLVEIYEARDIEKIIARLEENGIEIKFPSDKIFVIADGEDKKEACSFLELYEELKLKGKKGLNVVRYKGLGEMNPLQLWETTMDPGTRRMKIVTLEDAAKAEEIFTVLMGDAVEPRREFIERYAKEVKNLDI